jgi:hypothetical protein
MAESESVTTFSPEGGPDMGACRDVSWLMVTSYGIAFQAVMPHGPLE